MVDAAHKGRGKRGWKAQRKLWKAGWVGDLDGPGARTSAALDALVFDHGLLRLIWRNMHEVEPGLWRSNQPGPRAIRALAGQGFRTIVNLRGVSNWGSYLLEREACAAAGLTLVDLKLRSHRLPAPGMILGLLETLRTAERPLLMHCKSGADRVGIATAMHLLARGRPLPEARRALSLAYLHVRAGKTGILDAMLDAYEAAVAERPVGFLDWVRDGYDPDAITAGYRPGALGSFFVERVLGRE